MEQLEIVAALNISEDGCRWVIDSGYNFKKGLVL